MFFPEYSQKRGKSEAKFPMQMQVEDSIGIWGHFLMSLSNVKKVFNMICEIELTGLDVLMEESTGPFGQLGFLV